MIDWVCEWIVVWWLVAIWWIKHTYFSSKRLESLAKWSGSHSPKNLLYLLAHPPASHTTQIHKVGHGRLTRFERCRDLWLRSCSCLSCLYAPFFFLAFFPSVLAFDLQEKRLQVYGSKRDVSDLMVRHWWYYTIPSGWRYHRIPQRAFPSCRTCDCGESAWVRECVSAWV